MLSYPIFFLSPTGEAPVDAASEMHGASCRASSEAENHGCSFALISDSVDYWMPEGDPVNSWILVE